MRTQKKSVKNCRQDAAIKRLNTPLAYQKGDVWLGYVDEKGKPAFVDKEGNPLSYAQLSTQQKLEKLQFDIACNKHLQPYQKEDGSTHTPCERQRKRLQALIDAKKVIVAKKAEEKKPETTPETPKAEEKRADGKKHKKSRSDRRYM